MEDETLEERLSREKIERLQQQLVEARAARVKAEAEEAHMQAQIQAQQQQHQQRQQQQHSKVREPAMPRNPKQRSKKKRRPEQDSSKTTGKTTTTRKKRASSTSRKGRKDTPRQVKEPVVQEDVPEDDETGNKTTVMAQSQEEEEETYQADEEIFDPTQDGEKSYTFCETHLMSTYTPRVLDCSPKIGRLLVEWFKTSTSNARQASSSSGDTSSNNHMLCRSWVKYQDFPFPSTVMSYIDNQLQSATCDKTEEVSLKKLMAKCNKFATRLEKDNTFTYNEDDPESMLEVDFCCFVCKCPPGKHALYYDDIIFKYHRKCCHGMEELPQAFQSPVGKIQNQIIYNDGAPVVNLEGSIMRNGRDTLDPSSRPMAERQYNWEFEEYMNKRESSARRELTIQGNESALPVPDQLRWQHDGTSQAMRKFAACCKKRKDNPQLKKRAVVLDLFGGIGAATVVLKKLGIAMRKIIHVDHDPVAQHVYRSNHDPSYGVTTNEDGIKYVCGLYERFEDVEQLCEDLVRNHGPVDLVIGGPPCQEYSGINAKRKGAASVKGRYMTAFPKLIQRIEQLNRELFEFDDLVYLCENVPGAENDGFGVNAFECDAKTWGPCYRKRIFYFNWIPESYPEEDSPAGGTNCLEDGWMMPTMYKTGCDEKVRTLLASYGRIGDPNTMTKLRLQQGAEESPPGEDRDFSNADSQLFDTSDRERIMGFPVGYVEIPNTSLFENLRKAYLVATDNKMWRNELHPRYWPFLGFGPGRYKFKHCQEYAFGDTRAYGLELLDPNSKQFFSDYEYAWHLLGNTFSIPQVMYLMKPLQDLFKEQSYEGFSDVGFAWDDDEGHTNTTNGTTEHANNNTDPILRDTSSAHTDALSHDRSEADSSDDHSFGADANDTKERDAPSNDLFGTYSSDESFPETIEKEGTMCTTRLIKEDPYEVDTDPDIDDHDESGSEKGDEAKRDSFSVFV